MKNADLDQIVESCDKDKDGEIDYHEFLEALGIKKLFFDKIIIKLAHKLLKFPIVLYNES